MGPFKENASQSRMFPSCFEKVDTILGWQPLAISGLASDDVISQWRHTDLFVIDAERRAEALGQAAQQGAGAAGRHVNEDALEEQQRRRVPVQTALGQPRLHLRLEPASLVINSSKQQPSLRQSDSVSSFSIELAVPLEGNQKLNGLHLAKRALTTAISIAVQVLQKKLIVLSDL